LGQAQKASITGTPGEALAKPAKKRGSKPHKKDPGLKVEGGSRATGGRKSFSVVKKEAVPTGRGETAYSRTKRDREEKTRKSRKER